MNVFTSLFRQTLTYKFYDFIKSSYIYIRDYRRISKTLYSDDFKQILKKYLNIDIDTDWIGRLYGIINPMIDINGHFDVNNSIIEINGDLTNNNDQIQYWAHKQMKLIGSLFKINNLYNYISMNIEHVGPNISDNYLVVFDMISRKNFVRSFKNLFIHISILLIIILVILLLI